MDFSPYRGFHERTQRFFDGLETAVNKKRPELSVLKQHFVEEVRRTHPLSLMQRNELRRSFRGAFWAYRKIVRRRGEAYIFHVMRGSLVATWIMEMFGVFNLTVIHAALFHDSYEETEDTWFAQLLVRLVVRLGIGSDVASYTHHLTKHEDESDEAYFFRLFRCGLWIVLLVKFVDRIDNLWTLDTDDRAKQERKVRETEAHFSRLGGELKRLVAIEVESERLSPKWLDVVTFLDGYLWYAVSETRRRLGMP